MSPEERAKIARENGAKSRGPKTEKGKEKSRRNALKDGNRATTLKHLMPPHSSLTIYEDRQEFYNTYDRNIEKYEPRDDHENAIVREITGLEWQNLRLQTLIHAQLNRAIIHTAPSVEPIHPQNGAIENTLAAYDAIANSKSMANFHKQYGANIRVIATLERRLRFVQKSWPARIPQPVNSDAERAFFDVPKPEPDKRTEEPPPQPVENTTPAPEKRVKIINVYAPLTPEKIRTYQQVFPNRELQFNIIEPPNPKAA